LQVVLKDCNANEIYRSQEGKSKYKEYDKTYQDALRKAFKSIEALGIKQKDVELLNDTTSNLPTNATTATITKETEQDSEKDELTKPKVFRVSGNLFPDAKFSNY